MTQEEMALTIFRGVIAGLPPEQQSKVIECADKIKAIIKEYGDEGQCACGLVGAELATKV
jgi:hypothetical protein